MSHTEASATISLEKAIKEGLNEVSCPKTLEIFEKKHGQELGKHMINFRGDVAERHGYAKIQPTSVAKNIGHLVYIQGKSSKTGEEGYFQILANRWGLLEVLAKLD